MGLGLMYFAGLLSALLGIGGGVFEDPGDGYDASAADKDLRQRHRIS